MHPAPSIIFFTSLSGAGYGLLFWLGLLAFAGRLPQDATTTAVAALLCLGLIVLGLLSSLLHLKHPERAWRALSEWRSSWLSREGVLALLTFLPALVLFAGWLADAPGSLLALAGTASALLALLTVFSTAMIYAGLKSVPTWNSALTPACYLAFNAATGFLLLLAVLAFGGFFSRLGAVLALLLLMIAWGLKIAWWRRRARLSAHSAGRGSAVGAPRARTVRSFTPAHSEPNYLLREMGFEIGRLHARRLRRLALLLGLLLPSLLLLPPIAAPALAVPFSFLAAVSAFGAVLLERWLFFAEAEHSLRRYY